MSRKLIFLDEGDLEDLRQKKNEAFSRLDELKRKLRRLPSYYKGGGRLVELAYERHAVRTKIAEAKAEATRLQEMYDKVSRGRAVKASHDYLTSEGYQKLRDGMFGRF